MYHRYISGTLNKTKSCPKPKRKVKKMNLRKIVSGLAAGCIMASALMTPAAVAQTPVPAKTMKVGERYTFGDFEFYVLSESTIGII